MKRRKLDFCSKKFLSLLGATNIGVLVGYFVTVIGLLVSGIFYGEAGLSAVNLVLPIFTLGAFVALLTCKGGVMLFSFAKGDFNKKESERVFSQGFIMALSFGFLMFIITFFGKNLYFKILNPEDEVLKLALEYYKPYPFLMLIYPLYSFINDMTNADGDERVTSIANISLAVMGIVGGTLMGKYIGMVGISLGTTLGVVLALLIFSSHFLKKKNTLKLTLYFKIKKVPSFMKYGMTDAIKYLCSTLWIMILNYFVIARFGSEYLPILAIAVSTLEMAVFFDGIGEALNPIVSVFIEEKNNKGIRNVMKTSLIVAVVEGLVLTIILLIFANQIPYLFGLKNVINIKPYALAIRISAISYVFISLKFLLTSYYTLRERFLLAISITLVSDLIVPVLFGILFSSILSNINGLWIGFILGPIISILFGYIIVRIKDGKNKFPLLLDEKYDCKTATFDYLINKNYNKNIEVEINRFLSDNDLSSNIQKRVNTLTKEMIKVITLNNTKDVSLELFIAIRKSLIIVVRYDGIIINLKEEIESNKKDYKELSNLISSNKTYKNIIVQAYNRNEFRLEI